MLEIRFKFVFFIFLVTALANKKFPEDDDCTSYGQLTEDIFSVQSRALKTTSNYINNQEGSLIVSGNVSSSEQTLEEKMWSAMSLDSPPHPLPLIQKRENFYY